MTAATSTRHKAADLYHAEYARRYREHDDELANVDAYARFCAWLGEVCDRFDREIDVLDLGCGTGRYFRSVRHVRTLVGIDASAAMLAEARAPLAADQISARTVRLVHGDIASHPFDPETFDLAYAVGVLAEHMPLDDRIVANVWRWLRPGGRFAFTTVHPESSSVPRTVGRVAGQFILPFTAGPLRRRLRQRLTADGRYADETLIHERLHGRFVVESLVRLHSEAHLHCVCTARKVGS
jgi:SAM-dependent methyltransferase